ncbi:MAG TPA: class I SAM-dependent methyltransferase [Rhizomicrobium sp.]|jgi:2-polyprenyl-3-methyl-5-hydroxy-6-metoxy-1,4-benzoquinol methylase|nr:class I SAM-dependent methyltransferase [Rhizomicrobium sp.]
MEIRDTTQQTAKTLELDELMERIRAEVSERKRQSGIAAPRSEPGATPPDFASHRWTARELLTLPTAEFVRASHLAFLGREPTPDEFVELRDRILVSYVGRMRIIREFRTSKEACARRQHLPGFWRESAKDRLYWSPPAKFGRRVAGLIGGIYGMPGRIREYIARMELLERRAAEASATIRAVQSAQAADRQNTGKQFAGTKLALRQLDNSVAAIERNVANHAQNLSIDLPARLSEIRTMLTDHWRTIVDQKFRTESLLSSGHPEFSANQVMQEKLKQEEPHQLDALYLSFEDRYRGTREDIKDRQRIYLARIAACVALTGDGSVFDIGCGRGEWLELLAERGIAARGYDANRIAVEECRQRGLDAHASDGLLVLAAEPDSSCSAITAFHVIEHIPFEQLVALLDHSLRVLRPNGLLILETPNPGNLIVAAEKFYFDPTHRNPLPCELTEYLVKSRGFEQVAILPLHPVSWQPQKTYEDSMLAYLQEKLFGPQDYAVIGRKPA